MAAMSVEHPIADLMRDQDIRLFLTRSGHFFCLVPRCKIMPLTPKLDVPQVLSKR